MNTGEANALNALLSFLRRHQPLHREDLERVLHRLIKGAYKALNNDGHSPDVTRLAAQQIAGLVRLAEQAPQITITAPPGTRIVAQDGFSATLGYVAEVLDAVDAIRFEGPGAEVDVRQPDGSTVTMPAAIALCDAIAPQLKFATMLQRVEQ